MDIKTFFASKPAPKKVITPEVTERKVVRVVPASKIIRKGFVEITPKETKKPVLKTVNVEFWGERQRIDYTFETYLLNTVTFNMTEGNIKRYAYDKYSNVYMKKDSREWDRTKMTELVNEFNDEKDEGMRLPFKIYDASKATTKKIWWSPVKYAYISFISKPIPVAKPLKIKDIGLADKIHTPLISYEFDAEKLFVTKKTASERITEQFKDGACLYNAFLEKYGDKLIDFAENKGRYKDFKPSIQYLQEFTGVGDVCSVAQFVPVLKKFGIDCKVFDINETIAYELPNEEYPYTLSKRFQTFMIMVHNNHAYLLDENIKRSTTNENSVSFKKPNSTFTIINEDKSRHVFTHTIEGIIDFIKRDVPESCIGKKLTDILRIFETVTVYHSGSLADVFAYLRENYNYLPLVKTDGNVITQITLHFSVNNYTVKIRSCSNDNKPNETYANKYMEFYTKFFNEETISKYTNNVLEIFNATPRTAVRRSFEEVSYDEEFYSVDISKSYPAMLSKMDFLPVFNRGDLFMQYNGEPIEPYNFYIIHVHRHNNVRDLIYLGKSIERVTGFTLMQYNGEARYTILQVCRPSKLVKNPAKEAINELWQNEELSIADKKDIMNINIGMMGKRKNTSQLSGIFTNYDEAFAWAHMFDTKHEYEYDEDGFPVITKPAEISDIEGTVKVVKIGEVEYYLAHRSRFAELSTGFLPIRDFIYDIQRLEMWKLYETLEKYEPIGMDTDAMRVRHKPNISEEKVEPHSWNYWGIGSLHLETEKKHCSKNILQFFDNSEIRSMLKKSKKQIRYNLDNEVQWKESDAYIQEFADIMAKHKRVFIEGVCAGAGKSALVKKYMGDKGLIVTPYNTLSVENRSEGYNSITLYMLVGQIYTATGDRSTRKYDVSEYDTIFFDEVFNYTTKDWDRIRKFCIENKDKKIILSGDCNQNQPIEDLNNIPNVKQYYVNIRDSIVNVFVDLHVNKRVCKEDAEMFASFKKDIFDETKSVQNVLSSYFATTNEFSDKYNICYTNQWGCDVVNAKVHGKMQEGKEGIEFIFMKNDVRHSYIYYEDLDLICRTPLKCADGKLYTNNKYTITYIDEEEVYLYEPLEDKNFILPIEKLKFFALPYASTGHRTQGLTIRQSICIHETDFKHVTREWIYTAVTRACKISDVFIAGRKNEILNGLEWNEEDQCYYPTA